MNKPLISIPYTRDFRPDEQSLAVKVAQTPECAKHCKVRVKPPGIVDGIEHGKGCKKYE